MYKNLLNNQNYVLGETEKKQLLTKFFVERNKQKLFKILTVINKILGSPIFVGFIGFIMWLSISYLVPYPNIKGILFIIIFLTSLLIGFLSILTPPVDRNYENIESLHDYFFKKYGSRGLTYAFFSIRVAALFGLSIHLLFPALEKIGEYPLLIPLLFLVVISGVFALSVINFFNTILFPFILLYQLGHTIVSIIHIFTGSAYKKAQFAKKLPKTNISRDFSHLNNNVGENRFYKVKV